ncbi:AbrB family transcriptional regulator [Paramesorhizobium deserti]|uniref:AbrB family transcriptional regulator n=1 Tax=Paramesorhizobium deserti TaxID=1494590 RepID=UPI0019101A91|nr:AbrB family transcriptional regulator [Paramesorhizobium deserti]
MWFSQILALFAAAAGGALFNWTGIPIGWVLGSLIAAALWTNATGGPGLSPNIRRLGQLVLGCATASILTPALLGQMANALPAMVLAAIFANGFAFLLARPFARIAGVDRLTAMLSVLPAGLAEMAGLAQDRKARADVVALAHTARVTLIVLTLPALVGAGRQPLVPGDGSAWATLACLTISLGLAWMMSRVGLLNPWIVLPVVVGAVFVLFGIELAALPPFVVIAAQILIGASLGARLPFDSFARMPAVLLAAMFSTLALFTGMLVTVGPLLHWVYDVDMTSLSLALAPGGLAEMLAAAKAVGADVPLVLGFQLLRSLLTNTAAPMIIRAGGRNSDPPIA